MTKSPSLDDRSLAGKVRNFQRNGLAETLDLLGKIHFLYITFLHFVKEERKKGYIVNKHGLHLSGIIPGPIQSAFLHDHHRDVARGPGG